MSTTSLYNNTRGNSDKILQDKYVHLDYGLNNAFVKLEKLIDTFDFIDLKEANNSVDWSLVKRVKF